jgi:hypothetical protein
VYTTGPFVGSISISDPGAGIAAEGHRPGNLYPTAAEHENYQQNTITAYVANWLALGSSAGAADAHIVETNALGRARVHGLSVIDAIDETAVTITSSSTFSPAVQVTCSTGATVMSVNMGTASVVGLSCDVTTGAGTGFRSDLTNSPSSARGFYARLASAAAGSFGIDVSADGGTAGGGIRVRHAGVNYAIEAISTGALAAFNATATAASTTVAFIAGGLTRALSVTSGTTAGADAIHATTINDSGFGMRAYVPVTATSAARGFYTSVGGSAIGAEFVSAANHALKVTGDTATPTYGPLLITECDAIPSSPLPNQIAIVRQTFGVATQTMESCLEDVTWRGFLSTIGGSALAQAYDATGTFSNAIGTWATALAFTATGGNAPKTAGRQVLVRINLSARSNTAATNATLGLRIIDITAGGGVVWTRSGIGSAAGSGWFIEGMAAVSWAIPITIIVPLTVTVAGTYQWRLEFQTAGPAGITIRDISIDFLGML